MITADTLRHAADLVAAEDPELGAALRELLAAGRIGPAASGAAGGMDPAFRFGDEIVPVRRGLLFEQGPPAVAERLLLKLGQHARKQAVPADGSRADWHQLGLAVRQAGRALVVDHALRARSRRLEAAGPAAGRSPADLGRILAEAPGGQLPWAEDQPGVFFRGVVDLATPALLVQFPYCREALEQVVAVNLEFFNVHKLLVALERGRAGRIFACLVRGRIVGLLELGVRRELGGEKMEVVAIATLAGRPSKVPLEGEAVPRGAGAMLLAGAWLLWRQYEPHTGGLVLDAEVAAFRFYEGLGFIRRGPHAYALEAPRGHFLRNVVAMAGTLARQPGALRPEVAREIERLVARQSRAYASRGAAGGWAGAEAEERLAAAVFLEECFRCRTLPRIAAAAAEELARRSAGDPFCERLLESAAGYGLVRRRWSPGGAAGAAIAPGAEPAAPVLVVVEDRFAGHLERVLHLESSRRLAAVQQMLARPELAGLWRQVPSRQATIKELTRVHTLAHVRRIARTAGHAHTRLDEDTQASERSWDVARLAAGGVLNLVDEIVAGPSRRGFAFVRPPGHHAGRERAAGFCLFNNVAVAARHLLEAHRLPRVLIVDIDLHHGNGTQEIFYDTDEVLYVSLHHFPSYPGTGSEQEAGKGRGEGYTINVPFRERAGEEDLFRVLNLLVRPVARQYAAGILLVSCGFDIYSHDPLGGMNVTPQGFALLAAELVEIAQESCQGRVAFVLEGGYSAEGIRECGTQVMQVLAGRPPADHLLAPLRNGRADHLAVLRPVLAVHRRTWRVP